MLCDTAIKIASSFGKEKATTKYQDFIPVDESLFIPQKFQESTYATYQKLLDLNKLPSYVRVAAVKNQDFKEGFTKYQNNKR